jgi:two-component system, OmpR family, phosphate regulon sensor histidine kinase PhoR
MTTQRKTRIPAQLLLLLALIILPALFYTGYEISRLDEEEAQIAALYERQLDAILFSVNQHAWDVSDGWIDALERATEELDLPPRLAQQASVRFAMRLDSATMNSQVLRHGDESVADITRDTGLQTQLRDSLSANTDMLTRLGRLRRSGYRKIEALQLPRPASASLLALVSATDITASGSTASGNPVAYLALCLEPETFIREVLGPKFRDLAGETEFVLTCTEASSGRVVVTTGGAIVTADGAGVTTGDAMDSVTAAPEQSRRLWLFPDFTIGIRLQGQSIEHLAKARSRTSIILFSTVGALLLAGAWLLYRNFRRELQLAEMKTDFVSNVSHELKTPLALIRMYAETLEMGRITDVDARQEYLGIIVKETGRLTQLINNILAFSRIESGRKQYRLARLDLVRAVHEVLGVYRFHLEHEGFRLHVVDGKALPEILADEDAVAEALPEILADEDAVAEALLNLLDNAMKYGGEGKDITVRTGGDAAEVWVEVEDNGIGIPLPLQKKIFEKFYRVSEGLVHTAKGSGLGLALVDHIMRGHNGRVDLRSTPGEGSRFRLVFPAAAREKGELHGTHSDH